MARTAPRNAAPTVDGALARGRDERSLDALLLRQHQDDGVPRACKPQNRSREIPATQISVALMYSSCVMQAQIGLKLNIAGGRSSKRKAVRSVHEHLFPVMSRMEGAPSPAGRWLLTKGSSSVRQATSTASSATSIIRIPTKHAELIF